MSEIDEPPPRIGRANGHGHGASEKQQLRDELNTMRALVCLLVKRGVQGATADEWATQITASEFGTLNGRAWGIGVDEDPQTGTLTVKVTGTQQIARPRLVAS